MDRTNGRWIDKRLFPIVCMCHHGKALDWPVPLISIVDIFCKSGRVVNCNSLFYIEELRPCRFSFYRMIHMLFEYVSLFT